MPSDATPGRARRLWLLARLERARRSLELLDRKRHALLAELLRLADEREQVARDWEPACAAAAAWARRANALGGASDVAVAGSSVARRASVEIEWTHTVGVHRPARVRCDLPALPAAYAAAASAAVAPAAAAHRRVIATGASLAVAEVSYRMIDDELRATERRHRAIERLAIPALEEELRRLSLHLDELERQDRVVTRWARQRRRGRPTGRGGGSGWGRARRWRP